MQKRCLSVIALNCAQKERSSLGVGMNRLPVSVIGLPDLQLFREQTDLESTVQSSLESS
jgi:hypothetical protein